MVYTRLHGFIAERLKSPLSELGAKAFSISNDWELRIVSEDKSQVVDSLAEIVSIAEQLLPLRSVQIDDDDPVLVDDLKRLFPASILPPNGYMDRALQLDQTRILKEVCKVLLNEVTRTKSFFTISSDGYYLDAHLQTSADPPMPTEQMLGKHLADVVGSESAAEILRVAKKAMSTGEEQAVLYSAVIKGEKRDYFARIHPRHNQFDLLVSRINQQ